MDRYPYNSTLYYLRLRVHLRTFRHIFYTPRFRLSTGSLIQFSLTSSPFNTGRRAPTIHQDEPFTVLHTAGLLPTKLISLTSPSLYFKQTGSLIQFSLTSSPFNTGRRAPTIYEDGPSCSSHWQALSSTQADELLLFMKMSPAGHYDELPHSKRRAVHYISNRQAPPYYSY